MIKLEEPIQSFIGFLNKEYPRNKDVMIKLLYGYDRVDWSVDEDAGASGFAVYNPNSRTIAVAMEAPNECADEKDWFVLHNIAHEYKHFMDDVDGNVYHYSKKDGRDKRKEDGADRFANKVVDAFFEVYKNGGE